MESCPFDLATQTHIWRGTTRELLTELKDTQAARQARARGDYSMAQTPIKLGIALTRLTKAAKAMGLHIGKSKSAPGSKGGERVRSITYCRPADPPQHAAEEGGNLGEP